MRTFARVYDATPHTSTEKSPYLIMFSEQDMRGKILTLVETADDDDGNDDGDVDDDDDDDDDDEKIETQDD